MERKIAWAEAQIWAAEGKFVPLGPRTIFLGLKTKFFMFFSISQRYFLLRIFLVIGVKPGKPLGMGEKSKAARPESGKAKKSKKSSIY